MDERKGDRRTRNERGHERRITRRQREGSAAQRGTYKYCEPGWESNDEHLRPSDGRMCQYVATSFCNKCGWSKP